LPTINIKFADKKHLKGQEVFNRYGWRCPLTGELEPVIVNPDFRNLRTIIGCCGIAPDAPPFYFWMHDKTNDALNVHHASTNSFISTEIIKALYSMI
jgi:hypothetical protein